MRRKMKFFKVRINFGPYERRFILARGYRDALRIQKLFGGRIV